MKNIIVQFIKFGFVGGLCFLIDYGLMVLLTEVFSVPYLVSCAISFSVSVVAPGVRSRPFRHHVEDLHPRPHGLLLASHAIAKHDTCEVICGIHSYRPASPARVANGR